MTSTAAADAFMDLLAERVAALVIDRLATRQINPQYATARRNPLGSPRVFLDAARRGAFRSHKVGREVRAVWQDVDAYIRSLPPQKRQEDDGIDIEAMVKRSKAVTGRRGRGQRA